MSHFFSKYRRIIYILLLFIILILYIVFTISGKSKRENSNNPVSDTQSETQSEAKTEDCSYIFKFYISAIFVKHINEISEFMAAANFVINILVIFFLDYIKHFNVKNFSFASVCNVSFAVELFCCCE